MNKAAKRQLPLVFWNSYLQLLIESHIVVVLSGFIQLRKPLYEWQGQAISMYFGHFCLTLATFLSILTSIWLYKQFKRTPSAESGTGSKKPGEALRD